AFNNSNKLSLKQIDILSRDYNLSSQDLQLLLRRQFSICIENNDLASIDYFQDLYETFEKEAPFEGLPADVRFHLERLRDSLTNDSKSLMEPLTSQLQDINSTNIRKNKVLWWLTIGSFLIGLVGVAIGAIPYFGNLKEQSIQSDHINKKVPAHELNLSEAKAIEMAEYYHEQETKSEQ
ncbi:hypothetical protein, partial [Acinetobacter puyangensis]|uniref:hypothetical protein n=1 Tax=Acinetobacter puyangensis TaxID=1096779 RepID=UPI003A4DA1B1